MSLEKCIWCKDYPGKEKIMAAIVEGIKKSTYVTEGSQFCNPIAARVLIEKELNGILWYAPE